MAHAIYEQIRETGNLGISLSFVTAPGGYHPLHWHEETEILYPLNGDTVITIEGNSLPVPNKHLAVIDSRLVHSTHCNDTTSMFVCIHVTKAKLVDYLPDIQEYNISCLPEAEYGDNFPEYLELCKLVEQLIRRYVQSDALFAMEAEGLVLQLFAKLLQYFGAKGPQATSALAADKERTRQIISYVDAHYAESLSLADVAAQVGLGKEYFCRFFKRHLGKTFLEYLSEVRLTHVYYDLVHTEDPVSVIMERNGFSNQSLFNKLFREIYGTTPSQVRK